LYVRYPIAAASALAMIVVGSDASAQPASQIDAGDTVQRQVRTFTGAVASGHSASLSFGTLDDARNRNGTNRNETPYGIFIRFENTISSDFDDLQDRVLTGVFFDIDGNPDLFGPNGFATGAGAFGGPRVGGQQGDVLPSYWAFREDLGQRQGDDVIPDDFAGPRYGLGAEAHGLFSDGELLGGAGSPPIDGLDGGLLSETGDIPGGPIGRNGDTFPLWRQFIQVEIYLRPEFFDLYSLDDFRSVSWQFGELGAGTSIPATAIPLPTGAALGVLGLAAVSLRRRR
jgi:hypothetical protein